jgi:hypothetical protein
VTDEEEGLPDPLRDEGSTSTSGLAREVAKDVGGSAKPQQNVPLEPPVPSPGAPEDPYDGPRYLNSLQAQSPFLDYFTRLADRAYPRATLRERVNSAATEHPKLFKFCWGADVVWRSLLSILVIAAVLLVLYKTLAPFPEPFRDPQPPSGQ